MQDLVALIAMFSLALLANFIIAPIIIHSTLKYKVHPTIEKCLFEDMAPDAGFYLDQIAQALRVCGFNLAESLSIIDHVPKMKYYQTLFINRATGHMALGTVIYRKKGESLVMILKCLEFLTQFADGHKVETTNVKMAAGFPPSTVRKVFRLPQLQDPYQLYEVHRILVSRSDTGAGRFVPPVGSENVFLVGEINQEMERLVSVGWFCHHEKYHSYRPTWKGSFLMTWKQLWPVKQIRLARIRKAAHNLLGTLGYSASA